ncbi:MAG: serine/threonine protein kinase [Anaerolineales bacterium]|nr:serine/threonine protein kinase [Anaerolineales bacterium]
MINKLTEKYEILSLVEQGGFGNVYRGRNIKTGKMCAIKENLNTSEEYKEQFQNEAKALEALKENDINHLHLPNVIEFISFGDYSYLVMDFIEGENVKKIVSRDGPLAINQAIVWISQIGQALYYLHSKTPPFVHRDVKPSNIIVSTSGQAFLIDFGLVKRNNFDKTLVAAKAFSSGYSPPEQYSQDGTNIKSDIYALGATLFSMITGEVPQDSVARLVKDDLEQQIQKYTELPISTHKIIGKAMALNLSERYDSTLDFIEDCKELLTTLSLPIVDIKKHNNFSNNKSNILMASSTLKLVSAQNINYIPSVNVDEKEVQGKKTNIITWEGVGLSGINYWLVRKYYKKSREPGDGEQHWICNGNCFEDNSVINGVVMFYTVFVYDGEHFSPAKGSSQAFIRTDDVENANAERENKSKVVLTWLPPQNVGQYSVIRNLYSPSISPLRGYKLKISDDINVKKPDNRGLVKIIDNNIPENVPVWYTIYCNYKKSRDTWVTSKGINVQVK